MRLGSRKAKIEAGAEQHVEQRDPERDQRAAADEADPVEAVEQVGDVQQHDDHERRARRHLEAAHTQGLPVVAHPLRIVQLDAHFGQRRRRVLPREAGRNTRAVERQRARRSDQQHLVQFGGPDRGMRKHVDEAADQRSRVLVVLGRQRPPLGHQAAGLQAPAAQLVEIARIEVGDPRCRRRRRFERDQVVALVTAQQLVPSVADANLHSRIRCDCPGCRRTVARP